MRAAELSDCLERRAHTAVQLADNRVDKFTGQLAGFADGERLARVLRDEIEYAREQRDALDDETGEPWQVLIDIDEEALEAIGRHPCPPSPK